MIRNILIAGFLLLFFAACNKNNEPTTSFVVRLTDSPGDYEAVNIDLKSVEVHASTGDSASGWTTLASNEGVYNLLDLTDGAEAVIASDLIPTGKVSQVRLVLGDNNSVVIGGETFPLTVPSGSQSGLKILINADLTQGITYSVLLDFDAAKSVVSAGASGKYLLKPVIKAVTEALDGAIQGSVTPADLNVAVYAIQGEDTISTSYAVEGNTDYFLGGLDDGTYTVSFDPGDSSGYQGQTIENVAVLVGNVTALDTVKLVQ